MCGGRRVVAAVGAHGRNSWPGGKGRACRGRFPEEIQLRRQKGM